MGPYMYLYEKASEVHYQDLQREAETRRLLARQRSHRPSLSWLAVRQLEGTPPQPPEGNDFTQERSTPMLKLAVRYARYVLVTLTTVGFVININ